MGNRGYPGLFFFVHIYFLLLACTCKHPLCGSSGEAGVDGHRLLSDALWLQGEKLALRHLCKCFREAAKSEALLEQQGQSRCLEQGAAAGKAYVASHRLLEEITGWQWWKVPSLCPTFTVQFRGDAALLFTEAAEFGVQVDSATCRHPKIKLDLLQGSRTRP